MISINNVDILLIIIFNNRVCCIFCSRLVGIIEWKKSVYHVMRKECNLNHFNDIQILSELIEILNNFLNNSKYINIRVSNIIIRQLLLIYEKTNLVINAWLSKNSWILKKKKHILTQIIHTEKRRWETNRWRVTITVLLIFH